ncbi:unnamed protein product, partial [Tenebrio molitor]
TFEHIKVCSNTSCLGGRYTKLTKISESWHTNTSKENSQCRVGHI